MSYAGTAWLVAELPCPDCGNFTVLGYVYVNEAGEHMHTRYRCTFWPGGDYTDWANPVTHCHCPCDWSGWSVPSWDDDAADRSEGGWDTDDQRAMPLSKVVIATEWTVGDDGEVSRLDEDDRLIVLNDADVVIGPEHYGKRIRITVEVLT